MRTYRAVRIVVRVAIRGMTVVTPTWIKRDPRVGTRKEDDQADPGGS